MTSSLRLEAMPNIDARIAGWLREVGIADQVALRDEGCLEAYRRLRRRAPPACDVEVLYALQAALMNLPASHLPEHVRQRLRAASQTDPG